MACGKPASLVLMVCAIGAFGHYSPGDAMRSSEAPGRRVPFRTEALGIVSVWTSGLLTSNGTRGLRKQMAGNGRTMFLSPSMPLPLPQAGRLDSDPELGTLFAGETLARSYSGEELDALLRGLADVESRAFHYSLGQWERRREEFRALSQSHRDLERYLFLISPQGRVEAYARFEESATTARLDRLASLPEAPSGKGAFVLRYLLRRWSGLDRLALTATVYSAGFYQQTFLEQGVPYETVGPLEFMVFPLRRAAPGWLAGRRHALQERRREALRSLSTLPPGDYEVSGLPHRESMALRRDARGLWEHRPEAGGIQPVPGRLFAGLLNALAYFPGARLEPVSAVTAAPRRDGKDLERATEAWLRTFLFDREQAMRGADLIDAWVEFARQTEPEDGKRTDAGPDPLGRASEILRALDAAYWKDQDTALQSRRIVALYRAVLEARRRWGTDLDYSIAARQLAALSTFGNLDRASVLTLNQRAINNEILDETLMEAHWAMNQADWGRAARLVGDAVSRYGSLAALGFDDQRTMARLLIAGVRLLKAGALSLEAAQPAAYTVLTIAERLRAAEALTARHARDVILAVTQSAQKALVAHSFEAAARLLVPALRFTAQLHFNGSFPSHPVRRMLELAQKAQEMGMYSAHHGSVASLRRAVAAARLRHTPLQQAS